MNLNLNLSSQANLPDSSKKFFNPVISTLISAHTVAHILRREMGERVNKFVITCELGLSPPDHRFSASSFLQGFLHGLEI